MRSNGTFLETLSESKVIFKQLLFKNLFSTQKSFLFNKKCLQNITSKEFITLQVKYIEINLAS